MSHFFLVILMVDLQPVLGIDTRLDITGHLLHPHTLIHALVHTWSSFSSQSNLLYVHEDTARTCFEIPDRLLSH